MHRRISAQAVRCLCPQDYEGGKRDLSQKLYKAAGTNAMFSGTETSGAYLGKEMAHQGVGSFQHNTGKVNGLNRSLRI